MWKWVGVLLVVFLGMLILIRIIVLLYRYIEYWRCVQSIARKVADPQYLFSHYDKTMAVCCYYRCYGRLKNEWNVFLKNTIVIVIIVLCGILLYKINTKFMTPSPNFSRKFSENLKRAL
ncbi:MAG: hypothetical protein ABIK73_06640 [candidate division WOR-3 bacterium]